MPAEPRPVPIDAPVDQVLAESRRRRGRVEYRYDPLTGEGSHEPRRPLKLLPGDDAPTIALPVAMWETAGPAGELLRAIAEAGDLATYAHAHKLSPDEVLVGLLEARCGYDFEYWAATCVNVDCEGELVPFVLRHPQRLMLREVLDVFWQGKPVLIVLLKARQWGGSTLVQFIFMWIQLFHRTAWHSAIIGDVKEQAGHVLQMYQRAADAYPTTTHPYTVTLGPYGRSTNQREVRERRAIIGVGSVENPEAVRGFTFYLFHATEVASWTSTPKKSAEALAQAMLGGLASGRTDLAGTMAVLESTAKGVGNFFHAEHLAAANGTSAFKSVFIPWCAIEKYQQPLESYAPADVAAFVATLDSYEVALWAQHGCTLEQIAFYRAKLRGFKGRRFMMQAEFPTTAQEAFISTGQRFFTPEAVEKARRHTARPPAFVGRLAGKGRDGKDALVELRLVEDEAHGPLTIWRRPGDRYGGLVKDLPIKRRYAAFADPGGKSEAADYSVCKIVDRAPMLWGGRPEVVAVWRGHLRPDLFAWAAAGLARYYDDAYLAVEVNRYTNDGGDEERGVQPEWSIATLEEIAQVYKRLYYRETQGRPDDPFTLALGFWTDKFTKPMLINALDRALEEERYIERSKNACDELDVFELRPDGKLKARKGNHDDEVIATAGAVWLALDCTRYRAPAYDVAEPVKRERGRPSRF
jgi:hypothetical protein